MEKKFTNVLVVLIVFLLSQMGGIAPLAVGQSLSCSADITKVNDAGQCSAVVTYDDPVSSSLCTTNSLSLGDIAFTGYISDERNRYSFVLLVNIPKGTEIHFTDRGWKASGGFRNISETIITWKATSDLPAGTEVIIDGNDASTGSMTGSKLDLDEQGDQIFAYKGTQPTANDQSNFLAAIQMNGPWDADASESRSAKPPVFTDGTNSISIYPEKDNAVYKCVPRTGTPAKLRSEINRLRNWETTNEEDALRNPPSCGFTVYCTASISLIEGLPSGSAFPVGTTTVTHRATYGDGSTKDCSFDVTVNDTEAPTANCPSDVTVGNSSGQCGVNVIISIPDPTDNCPGATSAAVPASGSFFNVGTTEVTVTATDAAGNTNTCNFNVVVNDHEAPTANCPSDVTVSNSPGQCGANVSFSIPDPTDNCPGATSAAVPASGSFFNVGTTEVTVTATDAAGNTNTCNFNVVVNDNEAPTANCPSDVTVNNSPGQCGANVSFSIPDPTDNCPGATSAAVPASGSFFNVGTTEVTVTATDAAGNTNTCNFNVVVNDTEAPTANCPSDVTVNNSPGQCGANVSFSIPDPTDNCPGATSAAVPASGSFFNVGTTQVTVTATDAAGNTNTCNFNVVVNDNEAPTANCPSDVTVNNSPGQCGANVSFSIPDPTDNCPGATSAAVPASGSFFNVGTTQVTVTATDAAGNTNTCNFNVVVNDNEAPTANCPSDVTVNNSPGQCGANVSFSIPDPTDNCPGATSAAVPASGSFFNVGTTEVTVTATDAAGNTNTCNFNVVVNDNEAPTANCPSDVTVNNSPGQCGANVSFSIPDPTDNCPGATSAAVPASGSFFNVGTTEVTVTATDAAGNTNTCNFNVVVNDTEAPTANCPGDITVSNTEEQCGANVSFSIPDPTDNCPGATSAALPASGSFFNVGTTQVTVTATDAAGNTGTCNFNVTVNDTEAPTANCPGDITVSNTEEQCGANVSFSIPDPTDNCPGATSAALPASGSFFNVGTTQVTVTATDAAGNTGTCNFNVTVNDTEAPTFSNCPGNINLFNDPGDCGAIASWTPPTLADNCPGATADSFYDPGDFFPVGTTTVTYTGTDAAGNDATDCSFTVSVTDIEEPIIACPANISTGTDPGECGAQVTFTAAIANDNCAVEEVKARYRPVDENNSPTGDWTDRVFDPSGYFPVGRYQVEWRAKDIYGSKRTCFQYLEVYDDEAPVAVCKDLTVDFNGEKEIILTANQVWNEGASSDNCGAVAFVSADLSISCEALGSTVAIPVTIADGAGNEDVCTAYVDVIGLPCGWSEGPDNGSLNCDGQTTSDYDVDDESFTLTSDGCRLDSDEGDRATYAYQPLCGDGTLTAKLASINTRGYAGLMAIESLDPLARRAGVLKNYSTRRVRREWRATYGGNVSQAQSSRSRVKWLRIVRKGNEIKSYTSSNGSYWRLLYKVTFSNLEDCIYVGMMAYSVNGSAEVEAVFEKVTLSGSGSLAGGLPGDNVDTGLNPDGLQAWGTVGNVGNGTIAVYPNPASNQAQIVLDGFADKPAKLVVRDAFGKPVTQIDLDSALGVVMPLEVQHLPAGIYMISLIQDDRMVINKKLVVQP